MILWKLWIYFGFSLTVAEATVRTMALNEKDVIDTAAGDKVIIRTWPYRGNTLYVNITKDNEILMNVSFNGKHDVMVDDKKNRLKLKYNDTARTLSLLLCNSSRNDEGLYHIQESIYETANDIFERQEGEWNFQLNVFDHDEMKKGNVGENMTIIELKRSDVLFLTLNHNEELVATATFINSVCDLIETSRSRHHYGRLKCSEDKHRNTYIIEIENVTQRDTGLYNFLYNNNGYTKRLFLNITDKSLTAMVGENVTIGWYYRQQGINRTLRVIHPKEGVMMVLQQSNNSTIRSNFHNRLLYSGDLSICYMSFTLLNLSMSDTGVYTMETQHGNRIPGWKTLTVEGSTSSTTTSIVNLYTSSYESISKVSYSQPSSLSARGIMSTSTPGSFTQFTAPSENPGNSLYGPSSSLRQDQKEENVTLETVLIYVIPVVTGAGILVSVIAGCLIWIQRKNGRRMEAVQRLILEKYETASIATPSTIRKPLLIHPTWDGRRDRLLPQLNALPNAIVGLPCADLPSTSADVHVACNITYSLSELDDDKLGLNNMVNCTEASKRSHGNVSVEHVENTDDDILDSSPSVLTLMSAKDGVDRNCNCIKDGCEKSPVLQSFQYLYAKVKKQSKSSSRNTGAIMCGDGYELVDLSRDVDIVKTFKVDDIVHVSTTNQTMSSHEKLRSWSVFVHGTRDKDEYKKDEGGINVRSVKRDKVNEEGDTIAMKDEEPTEKHTSSGMDNNDYAEIEL